MSTRRASRSRVSTSSRCVTISTPSAAPAAGTAKLRRRHCRPASWTPPASAISKPIDESRATSSVYKLAAGGHSVPGGKPDVSIQSTSFQPRLPLRVILKDILRGRASTLLTLHFGLSYSLLIFGGSLSPYLSYGVAATFIASAILAAVIAVGSSLPFAIGGPESSTAAMTGILASSMVERMVAIDPSAPVLPAVLITLAVTTILTGVVLCC